MDDVPDARLLAQFASNHSEAAFATLVERHIALVHSVARRHTANPEHARDITQAVFIILARKAGALSPQTVLPGWLYHTARLTGANFQRAETRRLRREQEAFMQTMQKEPRDDALWQELVPQLDEAMACLGAGERDALVLRYFQNKSVAEVGKFLGLEENTAQKRVSRALEKLRKFLRKRGVTSTAAAIGRTISANSVQAVPVALAKSVTAVALAKGAAASGSTLTLVKGASKIMAWTKAKMIIVAGAGILLAAGTTTLTIKEIQEHRRYSWELPHWSPEILDQTPPQVRIVPAKFPPGGSVWVDGKGMGIGQPLANILPNVYGINWARTVCKVKLPAGNYDFIANLPQDSMPALRKEIERKFGLSARREMVGTDVLLLTVRNASAPGLQPVDSEPLATGSANAGDSQFWCKNNPLTTLAGFLESRFGVPVIDGTGLTHHFNINLKWDKQGSPQGNLNALQQAVRDQLGLELVATNLPLEMLVVEKAN